MADLEQRTAVPLGLVTGMLGTKDADRFVNNFLELARELVVVRSFESSKNLGSCHTSAHFSP